MSSGLEGWTRFAETWREAWEDVTVVIAAWQGRGKASGVDTEWRQGTVWTLRDGRVASAIGCGEPSDALEAVGLSE